MLCLVSISWLLFLIQVQVPPIFPLLFARKYECHLNIGLICLLSATTGIYWHCCNGWLSLPNVLQWWQYVLCCFSWPPNLTKKARAIDTRGSRVEDKYKYLKEHLRFSLQYGCTWKRVHMVFPIRTTIEDVYGYPHFCTNPCGISWAWRNVGSWQAIIHPVVLPETSVQHGSVWRLSQQQLPWWACPRDMECALGVLDFIQSDLTWLTE